jgi:hypothetical protein
MCVLWVRLPEQLSDINDRDIEGIMYIRCNSTSQFQKSFVLNATVAYEGVSIGSSKCFRICILQFQSCRPYSDQNFGVTKTICIIIEMT